MKPPAGLGRSKLDSLIRDRHSKALNRVKRSPCQKDWWASWNKKKPSPEPLCLSRRHWGIINIWLVTDACYRNRWEGMITGKKWAERRNLVRALKRPHLKGGQRKRHLCRKGRRDWRGLGRDGLHIIREANERGWVRGGRSSRISKLQTESASMSLLRGVVQIPFQTTLMNLAKVIWLKWQMQKSDSSGFKKKKKMRKRHNECRLSSRNLVVNERWVSMGSKQPCSVLF